LPKNRGQVLSALAFCYCSAKFHLDYFKLKALHGKVKEYVGRGGFYKKLLYFSAECLEH